MSRRGAASQRSAAHSAHSAATATTVVLADFWKRQLSWTDTQAPAESDACGGHQCTKKVLGLTMPLKPVVRLMKADKQVVQNVSREAAAVMTVMVELFLRELAARAGCHMACARRVCVTAADVAAAAAESSAYDFLVDVLPTQELKQARAEAQKQACAASRVEQDVLAMALAQQHRRGNASVMAAAAAASLRRGVTAAQLLQQQHLQTLMARSAQTGASVVPAAHEYAAITTMLANTAQAPAAAAAAPMFAPQAALTAAAAAAATATTATRGGSQKQKQQRQAQARQAAGAPAGQAAAQESVARADLSQLFTYHPADAGVEGLSTVAIAHEAAEAENNDSGAAAVPSVHVSAFPTLWAQQHPLPPHEHEELGDENEDDDDDFDDDDVYDEEAQDLYDPNEDGGDEDEGDDS